jgi:Flp pilus assembly pilin Flp
MKRKDYSRERGANLVEYALLALCVAVIAMAGVKIIGLQLSERFSDAADEFN